MNSTITTGNADDIGVVTEDLCRFYGDNWKRRIALEVPSFYRWQFMEAPRNGGHDRCCVVVDGGDILGVMGLNERPFLLDGTERQAAELTTWVVKKEAQGRGLGKRIIAYLQDRYEVLLGMGITSAALPLYRTSGFSYMRQIPRFVRVFDAEAIAPYAQMDRLAKSLIRKYRDPERAEYKAQAKPARDLAAIAAGMESRFNHFLRDGDHLRWRYEDHPVFSYQAFEVRGEGSGASVVFRTDEVEGMRIVHVMDCFGDDADMSAVLTFIDDYCREAGAHVVDFYCTSGHVSRHFRARGWFSVQDDECFRFIHLFHPPELREPPTTSLVYWTRRDMLSLMDSDQLYVTKQDLDLDRPTALTYETLETAGAAQASGESGAAQ
ncbi:MAG: GNAT family N-acetyltransferase [Alphaproteobacteria bacterium]|nr:GNAT family N-acetyltransferase [Alphaproteobacteria bacterium]